MSDREWALLGVGLALVGLYLWLAFRAGSWDQ